VPRKGRGPAGRANPGGVSYFCGAEDERTAVAEKRPHRGALATIGVGQTLRDLRLIDLAAGMRLGSPFECPEGYLRSLVESCELFNHLNTELLLGTVLHFGPLGQLGGRVEWKFTLTPTRERVCRIAAQSSTRRPVPRSGLGRSGLLDPEAGCKSCCRSSQEGSQSQRSRSKTITVGYRDMAVPQARASRSQLGRNALASLLTVGLEVRRTLCPILGVFPGPLAERVAAAASESH